MIKPLAIAAEQDYVPIPRGELKRLLRQARRGGALGKSAMQRLLLANIRLIHHTAARYRHLATDTVTHDDLIQTGYLAFIDAVRKYDSQRGVKFCTYAVVSMRRRIMRAIDNQASKLRVPVYLKRQERQVRAAASQLSASGCALTPANISDASGLTERQLARLDCLPRVVASLDAPFAPTDSDELSTLADRIPAPQADDPDCDINRAAIVDYLQKKLSARQYRILALHAGLDPHYPNGLDIASIAKRLGVSKQAVRQTLDRVSEILCTDPSGRLRSLLQP